MGHGVWWKQWAGKAQSDGWGAHHREAAAGVPVGLLEIRKRRLAGKIGRQRNADVVGCIAVVRPLVKQYTVDKVSEVVKACCNSGATILATGNRSRGELPTPGTTYCVQLTMLLTAFISI